MILKVAHEFPDKRWDDSSLNSKPLKKLRDTGTTGQEGYRSARIVHTDGNVNEVIGVNDLVLSQKGAPKTRRTTRQIAFTTHQCTA